HQIALIRRELDLPAVGGNGAAIHGIGDVVDRDVAHPRRSFIEMAGLEIKLPLLHRVEYLLTKRERWLGAEDVHLEHSEAMVGSRQNLVVKSKHYQREDKGQRQRWQEELAHRDAARLERGDLVFRGE